MKQLKSRKTLAIIILSFFMFSLFSEICSAQNYTKTYFLVKERTTYQLTLSITNSLYEYYQQKSHHLTLHNFASFVTPYSLELVATDIRGVFPQEEEFVNSILMITHQIPYQIVEEAKYPVETIVDNYGDCDLLSYIAASLIKAQEIDVVLLYYEQESHMNIGVSLLSPPQNARTTVYYVDYEGTRYYMAECTGEDWRDGWRVGECPSELEGATVTVVTLENCEQIAPGQVSSSFGTLESSIISLFVSPAFVLEGNSILASGQVSVSSHAGTVTLFAEVNGNWFSIGTIELDSNGRYVFSWSPSSWGQCNIKASWSGDSEFAGADSHAISVFIIPKFLIFAACGLIALMMVSFVLLLIRRTSHPQEMREYEVVYQ